MDKNQNNKNNLIQRIKQINKSSNLLYYNEYLVKYYIKNTRNESNDESIMCIEREINLMKKIFGENIKEGEKEKFHKNMKEKFKKEMKIISNFFHPSLIKIIDFFEYPEDIFHVISENYQCSLEEFIKMQQNKKKYFSEKIILSFFTQICLGIKYIHDLNIIHRNINPSNILLISNRIVKLSNFELIRVLFTSSEKSITLVHNTWNCYISPEMGLNIPYSFKNDIWSLGILLFHMMALKVPFNLTQLNIIQNTKKVDHNFLLNRIPKHFSNDIKLLCVDLLKAYPADRPDINTVLNKYRIIKNEIEHMKKTLGNNVINNNQINTNNNNNIKNLYKKDLKIKLEEKNKDKLFKQKKSANELIKYINRDKNNNIKKRYKSFYSNHIKICDDNSYSNNNKNDSVMTNKKKDVINTKEKENLKISVYDNIMEKIKDPNNIMGQNYITGEIINIPDNSESLDFLKFNDNMNTNNSNQISNISNNMVHKKEIKEK